VSGDRSLSSRYFLEDTVAITLDMGSQKNRAVEFAPKWAASGEWRRAG